MQIQYACLLWPAFSYIHMPASPVCIQNIGKRIQNCSSSSPRAGSDLDVRTIRLIWTRNRDEMISDSRHQIPSGQGMCHDVNIRVSNITTLDRIIKLVECVNYWKPFRLFGTLWHGFQLETAAIFSICFFRIDGTGW